MSRSKAFFINGGAGRVLCSVPAFEKYQKESGDDDFIIVCEGGSDLFKGHPDLDERTYDIWHKNLFKTHLADRDIVSLEPYRIWEYYTQQCSLTQAFDIEINQKGIRNLPRPNLFLSKDELLVGRQVISEVKKKIKKQKTVVFQPFGRSIEYIDETLIDKSGRSFELKDVKRIVKGLQKKGYCVIIMAEFKIDFSDSALKDEVAMPEGLSLRQWGGVIKFADKFLGCDSVGQHIAYSLEKDVTVVTGSTYPINVSYPNADKVDIMDMGEIDRVYSPIRIVNDEYANRKNENLMSMTEEITNLVVEHVNGNKK